MVEVLEDGSVRHPVFGVFLRSKMDGIPDGMIFMAFSEEAAESKRDWHAYHNSNFKSDYVIRRIDQEELDENARYML